MGGRLLKSTTFLKYFRCSTSKKSFDIHGGLWYHILTEKKGEEKMKEYKIYFTKYYSYYVEADSEEEAIEIAEGDFEADMRCPIADTTYDEVEVEEV